MTHVKITFTDTVAPEMIECLFCKAKDGVLQLHMPPVPAEQDDVVIIMYPLSRIRSIVSVSPRKPQKPRT